MRTILTLTILALLIPTLSLRAQSDQVVAAAQRRGTPGQQQAEAALAARVLGLPRERLEQTSVSVEEFPFTGTTLIKVKAVERGTGRILVAAVDQDLRPVDPQALMASWRKVLVEHPEVKWQHHLSRVLDENPLATRSLVVWLRYPGARYADFEASEYSRIDWQKTSAQEVAQAERRIGEFVLAQNVQVTEAFRARLLSLGLPVTSWSRSAPVVFTSGDRAAALALAQLPEVDAIFLQNFQGTLDNVSSNRTHRTHRLHQMGVKGRDIALTILERGTIDPFEPDLLLADWFHAPGSGPSPALSAHTTAVGGCAASRRFLHEGAAPDVDLLNANATTFADADLVCAGDWVVFGPGGTYSPAGCASVPGPVVSTDITSMSFGTSGSDPELQFIDRYFEYQVRFFNDTYINSAGNRGLANGNASAGDGDGEVTSPGKAWNVITVGNWNDMNNGSWEQDAINPDSSYLDPAFQNTFTGVWTNLCRKPNLVASGTSIQALGPTSIAAGSWTGTSMSTPYVAGNLADAMALNPVLTAFPEASMALMMATAWNHYNVASLLDDRSGVGAIVGLAAVRVARDKRVRGLIFTPLTFAAGAVHAETITLEKSDRARICMAWSADVSTSYMYPTGNAPHSPSTVSHRPNADLDLAVYRGTVVSSANLVAISASALDNYELVEFTPTVAGIYTVVISAARYDGPGAEAVGLAWSQRTRDISYVELLERAMAVRQPTSGPTVGAGTMPAFAGGPPTLPYILDVFAPDNPLEPYFAIPSGTLGDGTDLSGVTLFPASPYALGSRLPVTLDAFFNFFVATTMVGPPIWAGFAGATDPGGFSGIHELSLPPLPGIEGLSFFETALVADVNASGAGTIAEARKVTLWPLPLVKSILNDDSFVQALPFGFKFFGTTYTECHVNSNGNVTFGAADPTGVPSLAGMYAGPPRISFLGTDLDPIMVGHNGPSILRVREIFQFDSRVVIEFIDVTEHSGSGSSSTIRVTLADDDSITMEYLGSDPTGTVVVGITRGAGASMPPATTGELDLTSFGLYEGAADNALLEEFGPGEFDLTDGNPFWDTLRFIPLDAARTEYRVELELRKF